MTEHSNTICPSHFIWGWGGMKNLKFQPLTMCNRTGGMSLAPTQDLSILKTNIPPTEL